MKCRWGFSFLSLLKRSGFRLPGDAGAERGQHSLHMKEALLAQRPTHAAHSARIDVHPVFVLFSFWWSTHGQEEKLRRPKSLDHWWRVTGHRGSETWVLPTRALWGDACPGSLSFSPCWFSLGTHSSKRDVHKTARVPTWFLFGNSTVQFWMFYSEMNEI
jgi:hypothetical protein